jgi:hypothetical protein
MGKTTKCQRGRTKASRWSEKKNVEGEMMMMMERMRKGQRRN